MLSTFTALLRTEDVHGNMSCLLFKSIMFQSVSSVLGKLGDVSAYLKYQWYFMQC